MLPGLRFLFATIVLAISVLVFGLGAAALLRAAHEDFASLPSWRLAQQPLLAPQFALNPPSLAMLRIEAPVPKSLVETARPQQVPVDTVRHDILRYETARRDVLRPAPVHLQSVGSVPAREVPEPKPAEIAARTDGETQDQAEPRPAPAETSANLDMKAPAETPPAAETPAAGTDSGGAPAEATSSETSPAGTKAVETGPADSREPDLKQAETRPTELKPVDVKPAEDKPRETEATEQTWPETISPEIRSSEATAVDTLPPPAVRRSGRTGARSSAQRRAAAIARAERARVIEQQRLQKNAFPLFGGG